MKKWLLLLLILVFASQVFANTQDAIITFPQNNNVTLNPLCLDDNNNPCTATYSCNITTWLPNGSINYSEKSLSYQEEGFFYTDLGKYQILGDYKSLITCVNPDGETASNRMDFRIIRNTQSQENRMIGTIIAILIFIAYFIFMGMLASKYIFKFFCFSISLIQLLLLAFISYASESGASLIKILQINMIVMLSVGFLIGLFAILNHTIQMTRLDDDKVITEGKWGNYWK